MLSLQNKTVVYIAKYLLYLIYMDTPLYGTFRFSWKFHSYLISNMSENAIIAHVWTTHSINFVF